MTKLVHYHRPIVSIGVISPADWFLSINLTIRRRDPDTLTALPSRPRPVRSLLSPSFFFKPRRWSTEFAQSEPWIYTPCSIMKVPVLDLHH